MKKKLSIIFLTLVIALASLFPMIGVLTLAEGNIIDDSSCYVYGASIRYNGQTDKGGDIRYEFHIKDDAYTKLVNPKLQVVVGFEGKTKEIDIEEQYVFDKVLEDGTKVKAFRVYFYNIKSEDYSKDIAVAIKVVGDNVHFTSKELSRSVEYVANAALNDTESIKTDEQYTQLLNSLNKHTIRSFNVPSDVDKVTLEKNDWNEGVVLTLKHNEEFKGEKGVLEVSQKVTSGGWTPFNMGTINSYDSYIGKYVVVRAYFEKTEGSAYVDGLNLKNSGNFIGFVYPKAIQYNEWIDYIFECEKLEFGGLSFGNHIGTDSKFYIGDISIIEHHKDISGVLDFETNNGITNGLTHGDVNDSQYGMSDWGKVEVNKDKKYVGSGNQSIKLTIPTGKYIGQTFYDNDRIYGGEKGADTFTFYAYVEEDVEVQVYLMTGSGNTLKYNYSKSILLKKGGHTYTYNFTIDFDSNYSNNIVDIKDGLSGFTLTNISGKDIVIYLDDFCFIKN